MDKLPNDVNELKTLVVEYYQKFNKCKELNRYIGEDNAYEIIRQQNEYILYMEETLRRCEITIDSLNRDIDRIRKENESLNRRLHPSYLSPCLYPL